jgi:hypothetical protein
MWPEEASNNDQSGSEISKSATVIARAMSRAEVSFTKKTEAAPISGRKISTVSHGKSVIGHRSIVIGDDATSVFKPVDH